MYIGMLPLLVLLLLKWSIRGRAVNRYDLVKYQDLLRDMLEYIDSLEPVTMADKTLVGMLKDKVVEEYVMVNELLIAGIIEAGVMKFK